VLTLSEKDYRELQKTARLWKAGKISEARFSKLAGEILGPIQKREELKRKLRDVDAMFNKRGSVLVQGGLPSLGKRR